MGIERGIMEEISLHLAPWKFDLGVGYGLSVLPASETGVQNNNPMLGNYTSTSDISQVVGRVGLYWHQYGQSSFYFNVIGGEITTKQKRTGGSLSDRSGNQKTIL